MWNATSITIFLILCIYLVLGLVDTIELKNLKPSICENPLRKRAKKWLHHKKKFSGRVTYRKRINDMGQNPSRQSGVVINKNLHFSLFPHKNQTAQYPNSEEPIKFQYESKKKNDLQELRCTKQGHVNINNEQTAQYPNSEEPIKFQYESKKKNDLQELRYIKQGHVNINNEQLNNLSKPNQSCKNRNLEVKGELVRTQNTPVRTKSEPNLVLERNREKHRHRRKSRNRSEWTDQAQQFGYKIEDVDGFLARATLERPANIPVVLAFPSVLYQTRVGGYQVEISLPLGMVVNAVFKNQHWLYVQTPHAEEGYVSYAACLPLGIIPPPEDSNYTPCWEKSTDVFPKPSGNMTDTEKLSSKSDCEDGVRSKNRSKNAATTCGEKCVDRLYLRAVSIAKPKGVRHTLLVIVTDFKGNGDDFMTVRKGEVVFLLDANIKGWFYVKKKEGVEGYIPAAVAGHGFL